MSEEPYTLPDPAKQKAALQGWLTTVKQVQTERKQAAHVAKVGLDRLVATFRHRTGQSYKLRALLWSLYNGKPASLLECVSLDWTLHKDLAAVILAFGDAHFFYNEIKDAVAAAGQWDWFTQEGENE